MRTGFPRPFSRPLRWTIAGTAAAGILLAALGICEALGWPFLAAPMERWLGQALQRQVSLHADRAAAPQATMHLLGAIELRASFIEIGAPAWSTLPYTLQARGAQLQLGYADLWRASRGQPLHIQALQASQLDGQLERLADGRASWQFGAMTNTPDTATTPTRSPTFGLLQVDSGTVLFRDALRALDVEARFSLSDGAGVAAAAPGASSPAAGLQLQAKGSYRKLPLRIDAQSAGVLALLADGTAAVAWPVRIDAHIGRARLTFQGTATDALRLTALQGRFSLMGPSLAAVGDPLGVTLPTTAPFRAQGLLAKRGLVWHAVIEQVSIGSSRLAGAFTYDPQARQPLLAGRLTGSRLMLADLGPALGVAVPGAQAPAAANATAQGSDARPGRRLPDRAFDLPALRAMNANVAIAIDSVDLGTQLLEPLKPLRTLLVLEDGVLTLHALDARTAQGHLGGTVQFDGRAAQALWTADLQWDGVRLEHWIHQARANNAPPYVTGSLHGRARVSGQGRSTAAILGGLRGEIRMHLVDGTVSHLAVEAAGLDLAQGLGVLFKGDDALPIQCTVADLVAEQGVLRPRALVLDTTDSTLSVDGAISLASETIDLQVTVTPKDISPLALRAPIRLSGSFAQPSISVDKGKLGTRLGASALLALLNPLAALIPLIDVGDDADARRVAAQCRALAGRIAAKPALPAPAPLKPVRLPPPPPPMPAARAR